MSLLKRITGGETRITGECQWTRTRTLDTANVITKVHAAQIRGCLCDKEEVIILVQVGLCLEMDLITEDLKLMTRQGDTRSRDRFKLIAIIICI